MKETHKKEQQVSGSFHVYILRSLSTDRYYVGSTDDVPRRLAQHSPRIVNPSRWTRSGGPWVLVFSEEFANLGDARRAERFIKRMKSRKFIEQLLRGERTLPLW